jgi:bifunctional non-homologous end joining protein LigD
VARKSNVPELSESPVKFTNLDKVMYPETGYTKGDVIAYYTRIARYVLPHIENRPITLKRYPNGVSEAHFYEKDAPSFTPDWVKRFAIPRTTVSGVINYVLINDVQSLAWSANMANLEIHPFLAKAPRIDRPTMVVFDLDPGEGTDIVNACEAALMVKELLERLRLKSFAKVSGSKGIHVHVPLNTEVTYAATQPFAKSIAQLLADEHRDFIVTEMAKAKRKGKVFIDWSQNAEYKSTVAPYSLRAKSGRPFVAMPVTWNEIKEAVRKRNTDAIYFEAEAALQRAKKSGDIFAPVLTLKQQLPRAFLELMTDQPVQVNESDGLEAYRRKRDFTKTPEPAPLVKDARPQRNRRLFVIQKHAARQMHYDFRLEMDGTLKSWAVPKGPPMVLKERRLAMATEDHPMDYANFEGTIPKGEYGGGTVMVWDIGNYELIDGNYWQGKLHILLNGKKLKGEWVIVKGSDRDEKDNVWYLIKAGANAAKLSEKQKDSSALTRRSMEQIAAAHDAIWHSNRNGGGGGREPPPVDLSSLPDGSVRFIAPMLPRAVTELPQNPDEWSYEIKLDGYRCLIARNASSVHLWSRRENDITKEFAAIARACRHLDPNTLLDGEIVALDEAGRPSFNILQNFRSKAKQIQFFAFDLLLYKGKRLVSLPLEKRRTLLAAAVAPALGDHVRLSENFRGLAKDITAAAKSLGLEGIIAKRKDSEYQPGKRTGAWVKYKLYNSQEFVIGGYTSGDPLDAIIVGYYDEARLIYVAKVRNGFVPHVRRDVAAHLKGLETRVCPFANLPEKRRTQWALTREEMKNCVWIKPVVVAEVEFTEWTPDGHLRQAKFVALREDKSAREVVRETESAPLN